MCKCSKSDELFRNHRLMDRRHSILWRERIINSNLRSNWPIVAAMFVLLSVLASVLVASLQRTDQHLVYAMDDAYIHMAVAKNLAEHGVFGITAHGFTSASSSLLWPLILAGVNAVTGTNELAPFVINVLLAALLLAVVHRILSRHGITPVRSFLVLSGLILFVPITPIVFLGMEHTLHVLVAIVFFYAAASALANEHRSIRVLGILAFLVSMVRCDGVFAIVAAGFLLLLRRRFRAAVVIGVLGLLPWVVIGIISVAKGWWLVPNSIVGHASGPESRSTTALLAYAVRGVMRIASHKHLFVLAVASLLLLLSWLRQRQWHSFEPALLILFLFTLVLHTQFAELGGLYRYEAYLVGAGIVVIALTALRRAELTSGDQSRSNPVLARASAYVLVVLMALPLATRGVQALQRTPRAVTNIYEQQFQMGAFVREHYNFGGVATNDAGAINFFADIRHLDLLGLTNKDVAHVRAAGEYNSEAIRRLASEAGVDIAIVYEHWFRRWGGLPKEWPRLGQWTISNNVVCGGTTVSFYATDSTAAVTLAENLRRFSSRLPETVEQRGPYLSGGLKR